MQNKRPTAVLVMAILNFVFGAIGIFSVICGGVMMLAMGSLAKSLPGPPKGGPNPLVEMTGMFESIPGYIPYMIVGSILRLIAAVALIVAGVGLLKMRPWARWTSVGYGIFGIVTAIFDGVYTVALVNPAMERWIFCLCLPHCLADRHVLAPRFRGFCRAEPAGNRCRHAGRLSRRRVAPCRRSLWRRIVSGRRPGGEMAMIQALHSCIASTQRKQVILLASLACAACSLSFLHAAEAPRPPNIVFILADDLGYGDPRCYNPESRIPTPNIDRLAGQGMRFTDAHTPSAVCTPTRYGILTGRYCWRTSLKRGVLNGYSPALIEPGRMTVASLLKQHGYRTAAIGKWHLGLGNAKGTDYSKPLRPGPNAAGFDYFFGIPASLDMPPYVFVENEAVTEAPTKQIGDSGMRRNGGNGFWRAGPIAPSFRHADVLPRLSDQAVTFLQKQAAGRPFFLYLPLNAPHTPWMPGKEFTGKSGAGVYGDYVMQVDAVLGRVLQTLEDAKLAENTLVIFTSDNGAHWLPEDIDKFKHRANDGLRGQKADIWDGGHRVPFVARWPGKVKPGSVSKEPICLTDFLATAAAVVGAALPNDAGEDSFSILPVLLGKPGDKPVHEAIVHHSGDGTFGIRQGPWKLAMALGSHGFSKPQNIKPKEGEAKGQLYNLDTDPEEKNNLWLAKPEIVQRLTVLLKKYQKEGRSRGVK